jgi:hypothetical protein
METALDIVLPVFGLVICGYLVGRSRIIDDAGIDGLTSFVFYVAIPVLLFRTVMRSAVPEPGDLAILAAYFGGCFITFLLAYVVGRLMFRLPADELAIFGMGSMYGNTVMLGIPMVHAVFGDAGLVPILLIVAFHNPFLITCTAIFVEIGRGQKDGLRNVVRSAAATLIRNPVVLAILIALAWRQLEVPFWTPIDRFAGLLGTAAAPTALFALGASLAKYRLAGKLEESMTIVVLKLFVHPALVWVLATMVVKIDPLWAAVATLAAAMPTGANVFIYSRGYGLYVARATSATLISSGVSIGTVAILLGWLAPG